MKARCIVLGNLLVAIGLGGCQPQPWPDESEPHGPIYGDSVFDMAVLRLMPYVQMIDSVGRAQGALPARLETVLPPRWLRDIWGNPLIYSTQDSVFTVRSAGSDGLSGNGDDIFATGRLGRFLPCELRTEASISRFEERAPLCTEVGIVVLPRCPVAESLPLSPENHAESVRGDPVVATGEWLVRLARRIEGGGRALGALPPASGTFWQNIALLDAWGRPVVYDPQGHSFEVRSGGTDGILHSEDDILVEADLGGIIPCEFTEGGLRRRCAEFLPQCPVR